MAALAGFKFNDCDMRYENITTFSGISWRSDMGSRCEVSLAEEREELCWHQVNVGVRTLVMAPNPWNGDGGSICGICGELGIDSIAACHTHWEPSASVTHVPAIREDCELWRQFNDKKVNLFCHLSLFPLLLVNLLWLGCDSSRP